MRRSKRLRAVLLVLGAVSSACGDDETTCADACPEPTTIEMDFSGEHGFFGSPFPSDARRDAEGRPDIRGFPNPQSNVLVERVLDVIRNDADGFGVSSGIFFRADAPLDPSSLPTLEVSVEEGASVALVGVDPDALDYLVRYPVTVEFTADAGPYGSQNLLSMVPLQGVPLRPSSRYAAVVTRKVRDERGAALEPSASMQSILNGEPPAGMSTDVLDAHVAALEAVGGAGIAKEDVVALAVFTTGDPTSAMSRAVETAKASSVPSPNEEFTLTDEFPTFCVYAATIDMPVYQGGEPPYLEVGGGWVFDENGEVVVQRRETARFVVTIPKTTMPEAGYPMVVFSRTGGGGDRPLVDRGVRAEPGGEAVEPGTGPAIELTRAGFAGASVDGPHGGLRNVSGSDEQFLVFNFQNPLALRDNVRQSALELALMPEILSTIDIDVSTCPGAVAPGSTARFDTETMAIMGHSMGAAIAPLALVHEPRYRAAILSGAGGSFLANMIHKQKPLAVKPLAELILGLTNTGFQLSESTPFLSLLQWAGEPADNPIYGRHVIREPLTGGPRHVLMMQGIVDHYIMPPIANATSLSFGLDLAGDALDETSAELAELYPLGALLPFSGGKRIELPATENASSEDGALVTAVVTQTMEDGIEDGHEVAFQTQSPKHAYTCFLSSLAAGTPKVPSVGNVGDPCE
ncbi:MAG: hypothetical protein HOW73_30745 [Polyangiaceae bacterium]|nr:hypothetical protein [Polyangiaceae bacterium]